MTTFKSTWPVPTRCPVCGGGTVIERVRCDGCASAVEGRFTTGWVQQLSPEQLAFVRVFIACRGKIKDVEQALGLSYPTVVARLDDVVEALGQAPGGPPPPAPPPPPPPPRERGSPRRAQILDDLAAGLIDADEAAQRLKKARE
ncbi:DUF2089 domain-containing protein [Corallococcus sp. AB004]|uniref:DUF2089 domain-containing protein n=1 Tax=Corallococcus TaxID=83461 RepID=UPI000EA26A8F|nr:MULTISPECIES: DUF2089 domain-containing protein [Corallococcus]NPD27860.1 DUF2089 domain-containing protein [Corallococcus exiguus]NRD50862.1 DUF2089 domain-containing protein [Corallococcus exiguus]RKI04822.1 DUF2089 domain-containing protein [Corallococcus sp. AB038B]RKI37586.1 DUF2089 domain-containing protein [Corallococcus sp. AB004]